MKPTDDEIKAWRMLHQTWQGAFHEERMAQAICTTAFAECVQGAGTGPTLEQLGEDERLEKVAEKLAGELDQLMKNMGD